MLTPLFHPSKTLHVSNLIIIAAAILWLLGGAISILNPKTGEVWKTFTIKPLYPLIMGLIKKAKGTAPVLLLLAGALNAQTYDPASNTIELGLDQVIRLEQLARQGRLCNEAVTESEQLLASMEAQALIDMSIINSLRDNLKATQVNMNSMSASVRKLENELAASNRERNIYQNELKIMKKQKLYETIQWSAGAAIAVGLAAIILMPRR